MIALYRPGTSIVHRAPAWLELVLLVVLALGISLYPHDLLSAAVVFVAVGLLFALARLGIREYARQLWLARWILVLVAVTQLVFLTPMDAAVNTLRILSIVLLAAVLTLTTRSEDLLAALEAGLRPLSRLGVDPRRVSLTLSLAISMIPVVASLAGQIRDAQRARGVRLGFRIVVPVLVLALRHADDVADALTARGVD